MMNKRKILGLIVVGVFLGLVPSASSNASTVNVGDIVSLNFNANHSSGFNGGGFDVYKNGNNLFTTFCLETNEYFNLGASYYVSDISLNAINGGVGGGSPDPISVQTQYLYYHFVMGDLDGFSGTGTDQKNLQQAIWYLEQEAVWGSITAGAQGFVNLANNYAGPAINSVQVMNIVDPNNHSSLKQSQLIYVPEPATLILLGAGFLGLVIIERRKFPR